MATRVREYSPECARRVLANAPSTHTQLTRVWRVLAKLFGECRQVLAQVAIPY